MTDTASNGLPQRDALPDWLCENEGLTWALARAQYSFATITKSHTANAGSYSYKYADLSDVLTAIRPALNREGIALVQTTEITEAGVELVTSLLYADERLSSRWPLPIENCAPQQVGSVLTYLRRYALCALVGIAAEDDDDGRAASDVRQAQSAPARPQQAPSTQPPDDWETRPLASMTFQELRAVAVELGHPFSGGSKSELIRQLEPLVRAMSGEEPFDVTTNAPVSEGAARSTDALDGDAPNAIPFNPKVADPQARVDGLMEHLENAVKAAKENRSNPPALPEESGTARKQRDAIKRSGE